MNETMKRKMVSGVRKIKHTFSTVEELVAFVVKAERCSFEIKVRCNQLVIDGKSLMGVMIIGIGKPVEIICYNETFSPEQLVDYAA
ncbi:HPr family phosphocarrier protein [Lacrimispora sp.]|uniref:HPr family phosphocarrier protein n=1 Tax=Lacrimispora sp. TaxID=2719234 RepID=UPI003217996B